eukprot:gene18365-biopygen23413
MDPRGWSGWAVGRLPGAGEPQGPGPRWSGVHNRPLARFAHLLVLSVIVVRAWPVAPGRWVCTLRALLPFTCADCRHASPPPTPTAPRAGPTAYSNVRASVPHAVPGAPLMGETTAKTRAGRSVGFVPQQR